MNYLTHSLPGKQQGMVLIMALVILMAMTIVGVSSIQTSSMEERMAGNFKDRNIAFQAAEATLRAGERYIEANKNNGMRDVVNFNLNCDVIAGHCDSSDKTKGTNYWEDSTIWTDSSRHRTYDETLDTAQAGQYIIEFMDEVCPEGDSSCDLTASDIYMYRVTAIGYGKNIKTKVMLQSTYMLD